MNNIDVVEQEILNAIETQTPYSLIRIGDGEGRILMWPDEISRRMLDKHLKYWFGKTLVDSAVTAIRANLVDAISNADRVGIMHQPRNQFWRYASDYIRQSGKPLADIDVHKQMWFANSLSKYLKVTNRVALITCRNIASAFYERYEPQYLRRILVPEEANTGRKATNHWPRRYVEVCKLIEEYGSGWLYLVGAGVLGKSYCKFAKEAGNVAIDLGSIFDGWAGVKSRSFLSGNMEKWKL